MNITSTERTEKLLSILRLHGISDPEIAYRKQRLEYAQTQPGGPVSPVSDSYYNLSHEIRSFDFLSLIGAAQLTEDSKGTAGCDLLYNTMYQVECVCTSAGAKSVENGFLDLCKTDVLIDYSKKKQVINSRITSVLTDKVKFFVNHLAKGTVSADKPYIIFVGLGALAIQTFAEEHGAALTDVLFGRGVPTVVINQDGNVIDKGYSHRNEFPKPGAEQVALNCNLFCNLSFQCVSGILFSDAILDDNYSLDNTCLFLNPFAAVPANPTDFPGITYWSADMDGNYFPQN